MPSTFTHRYKGADRHGESEVTNLGGILPASVPGLY